MVNNGSNDSGKLNELLSQEVTDEELRKLLERLGEIEFAWSPRTTVGDVVEATASDPLTLGRLLANIRKEDWEERFGLRLSDVENRVARIENESSHQESKYSNRSGEPSLGLVTTAPQLPLSSSSGLAEETAMRFANVVRIILAIIAISLFCLVFQTDSRQEPRVVQIPSYKVQFKEVVLDGPLDGPVYATDKQGKRRPATKTEKDFFECNVEPAPDDPTVPFRKETK